MAKNFDAIFIKDDIKIIRDIFYTNRDDDVTQSALIGDPFTVRLSKDKIVLLDEDAKPQTDANNNPITVSVPNDRFLIISQNSETDFIDYSKSVTASTGFPDFSRVIFDANFACKNYSKTAPDMRMIPLAVSGVFDCSGSSALFADGVDFHFPMAMQINASNAIYSLDQLIGKLPDGLTELVVQERLVKEDTITKKGNENLLQSAKNFADAYKEKIESGVLKVHDGKGHFLTTNPGKKTQQIAEKTETKKTPAKKDDISGLVSVTDAYKQFLQDTNLTEQDLSRDEFKKTIKLVFGKNKVITPNVPNGEQGFIRHLDYNDIKNALYREIKIVAPLAAELAAKAEDIRLLVSTAISQEQIESYDEIKEFVKQRIEEKTTNDTAVSSKKPKNNADKKEEKTVKSRQIWMPSYIIDWINDLADQQRTKVLDSLTNYVFAGNPLFVNTTSGYPGVHELKWQTNSGPRLYATRLGDVFLAFKAGTKQNGAKAQKVTWGVVAKQIRDKYKDIVQELAQRSDTSSINIQGEDFYNYSDINTLKMFRFPANSLDKLPPEIKEQLGESKPQSANIAPETKTADVQPTAVAVDETAPVVTKADIHEDTVGAFKTVDLNTVKEPVKTVSLVVATPAAPKPIKQEEKQMPQTKEMITPKYLDYKQIAEKIGNGTTPNQVYGHIVRGVFSSHSRLIKSHTVSEIDEIQSWFKQEHHHSVTRYLLNAQYFDSYKQLFDARVNKVNTTPAQSHDSAVPAIKPKEPSAPAPIAPANEPKTTMLDVKAAEFLAMALIDKLNRLEAEVQAAQERMTTAQNAATQAQERVERAQQATQTAEDNVKEIAAQITEKLQSGSFDFADLRARGEQETRNAHQAKQELNAANFDKRNADFQFNMALEEYKTKRGIFVAAKSKVEQRNQALREKAELEKAAAAKDKEARDLDAELIKLLGGYGSLGD